jgi:hypothetical protein
MGPEKIQNFVFESQTVKSPGFFFFLWAGIGSNILMFLSQLLGVPSGDWAAKFSFLLIRRLAPRTREREREREIGGIDFSSSWWLTSTGRDDLQSCREMSVRLPFNSLWIPW